MRIVQFFYAYECPYCKRGFEYLMKETVDRSDITIEWRPIELYPQEGDHFAHISLACQSYYIAKELGADMKIFHAAMFQAIAIERQNAENPKVLCMILKNIVDTGRFRTILDSGKYAKQINENNNLAYEKNKIWFLPSFRMNGKKLDSEGGVGISLQELREFLKG